MKQLLLLAAALGALGSCGPNDARGRTMAIHTGVRWVPGLEAQTITVFRDNPPLAGVIGAERGTFAVETPAPPHPGARFIWDRLDLRFDRTVGATFRDERNPDGFLGAAPVGLPQPSPLLLQWHSNGLQLMPGQPVNLNLQRRSFEGRPYEGRWVWRDIPATSTTVVLDPATKIVAVSVVVVTEPGGARPRMDRALAEMWFDGRAVDRGDVALTNGGSLNVSIFDHDPLGSLDVGETASVDNGRRDRMRVQVPDEVWSVCGERYGLNIQFRLVSYGEVASTVQSPDCAHAATQPDSRTPYCVGGWATRGLQPGAPRAIPIVFAVDYNGAGVAQAYPGQGILMGERSVFGNIGAANGHNTMAHELGHYLGGDALFHDGAFRPSNLMADLSRNLTREQCEAAYRNADAFLVR